VDWAATIVGAPANGQLGFVAEHELLICPRRASVT
jgi:hypothetical protein